MNHIWDDLLSQQDKDVIRAAGYDTLGAATWDSRELGNKPALIIIDMQKMMVGEKKPILEAIEKERTAMGDIAWKAMEIIVPFVETCREAKLPIFFTKVIPRGRSADELALQIVEELKPMADEVELNKNYSSAFFGTSLLSQLEKNQSDTVILIGNSTSGCVRATAVDARQMGFKVLVPQECTFDRIEASHKIALLDMWMKYATVLSLKETEKYIDGIVSLDRETN